MAEPQDPKSKAPPASKTTGDPPWLNELNQVLDKIDPKDAEQLAQSMEEFLEGDITWARVQGIPQQVLFDLAEQAYLKFKSGRLPEAEALFKGLCIFDHKTAYYHTALGAIYQKQEKYIDALAEYTVAIELDPEDITAYVNRGEIYYNLSMDVEPMEDFDKAISMDPEGKDAWANRARYLKKQLQEYLAAAQGQPKT